MKMNRMWQLIGIQTYQISTNQDKSFIMVIYEHKTTGEIHKQTFYSKDNYDLTKVFPVFHAAQRLVLDVLDSAKPSQGHGVPS